MKSHLVLKPLSPTLSPVERRRHASGPDRMPSKGSLSCGEDGGRGLRSIIRNVLLSVAVLFPCFEASGQESPDSVAVKTLSDTTIIAPSPESDIILLSDTVVLAGTYPLDSAYMKHSPAKAAIMSAVLPGLGQIYNGKYWKVPVVYAAIGISVYCLVTWQNKYQQYRRAYIDMKDGDPYTNYQETLNFGPNVNVEGTITSGKDVYRRYRDWSIIAVVLSYGLNIIDANVDAHLLDFNVDDDLSLNIGPCFLETGTHSQKIGLNLRFTF